MYLPTSIFAVFFAQHGLSQYFRQHFLDKTFKGIYEVNTFDLCLLVPYFVVLILLATYGIHRYTLVYLYYKNKKNRTTEPDQKFSELPRVTVQLPIFNEQFVVERLLQAVCRLNYPARSWKSRYWTIQRMRQSMLLEDWSSTTLRRGTRSLITTGPTAPGSKRALCMKG
jgi:hypothetical protein